MRYAIMGGLMLLAVGLAALDFYLRFNGRKWQRTVGIFCLAAAAVMVTGGILACWLWGAKL